MSSLRCFSWVEWVVSGPTLWGSHQGGSSGARWEEPLLTTAGGFSSQKNGQLERPQWWLMVASWYTNDDKSLGENQR